MPTTATPAPAMKLLYALRFGAGVVVTITFQQIDRTPNTETSAQSHNEGLKNTNSRNKAINSTSEKYVFRFWRVVSSTKFHRVVVKLDCRRQATGSPERSAGYTSTASSGLSLRRWGQKTLYVKGVFVSFIIRCVAVEGMLGEIIFVGKERADTRAAGGYTCRHPSQQARPAHQFLAQLLIVQRVGNLRATALAGVVGVDGFLSQHGSQLFERTAPYRPGRWKYPCCR